MAGALVGGRALATSGDRAIAAELAYGAGRVTILGFDPTTSWLNESKAVEGLWRSTLPARTADGALLVDDSQLIQAVYQLPALALPPTEGLLGIIGAYILIIGPINYLILKRLDRRELAWVTMPVLVLAFAGAAFGYGALLKGTDVVINEVAIVHGAPDATEATAQVYFGIFSPNRATYRVDVPWRTSRVTDLRRPVRSGHHDPRHHPGHRSGRTVRRPKPLGRDRLDPDRPRAGAGDRAADAGRPRAGRREPRRHLRECLRRAARKRGGRARELVVVLGNVPARESRDVRLVVRNNRSAPRWRTRSSAPRSTQAPPRRSAARSGTRSSTSSPSTRWACSTTRCPRSRR